MSQNPFPTNPDLTAIAIAYRNKSLIADRVLPRTPVNGQAYTWTEIPKGQMMTVPETRVGRRGTPNRVEFNGTERNGRTQDYALDDAVPQADIEAAANASNYDPLNMATTGLTNLIELDREVRVANLVFDPSKYEHKATLDANSKWDGNNAGGNPVDPIPVIGDSLDVPLMRPNVMVLGQKVATKLRQNPNVIKAYNGSLGDTGMVPLEFLAALFELEEIVVGQGRINIAKPGQPVQIANVWGNHASVIYRNANARPDKDVTFGLSPYWGDRMAGDWYDQNIGMRGGRQVRVGESIDEIIMATDCAYFFENVLTS